VAFLIWEKVSDDQFAHLRFAHDYRTVARTFFGTPIQKFASSDEAVATAWLLESPPEAATIIFLPESECALVVLRVTGRRLRDADYETLKAELGGGASNAYW
jgi:hypothetical protein